MAKFARLGGSSVTTFRWGSDILAFARQTSIQSPTPVGPGTVPIHPLNERRPVELITPLATTMGGIQLELYELFGVKIWQRLSTLASDNIMDLADIFVKVAETNASTQLTIVKSIRPVGNRGRGIDETYHNIVISTLEDNETIEIGTMEVLKRIQINFTHSTWKPAQ